MDKSTALTRLLNKRVLIVGLGKTGLSCARFLSAFQLDVAVTDTRIEPPCLHILQDEFPDIAVFVGGLDEAAFRRADVIVVSPGMSLRTALIAEARARGAQVIGDIELFAWFVDAPVIAITGSNGKSTVTTLVGEMAHKAGFKVGVGGNIGTPALDLLQQDYALYVLELSSFQLETTQSLNACAAVLLNISEDHMDRYDSLADYASAKARVFYGDGVLVVNADDEHVMGATRLFGASRKIVEFGLSAPGDGNYGICADAGIKYVCKGQQHLLPVSEVRIKGEHNLANVLASLALGEAAGIPMPAMLEAVRNFTGLPHRCQWVAEQNGVTWINDSKATNVGAALAAIKGIDANKLVLIMGGQGKGQDFTPLREVLTQRARAVILIGEDAAKIRRAVTEAVAFIEATSMQDAVAKAAETALAGDVVLLSPACASFDMFSGFENRGNIFMQTVKEYLS